MNEMVEQCLRKLTEELHRQSQLGATYDRLDLVGIVRSVIVAVRDPTESMMDAAMNVGSFPMCDGEVRVRHEAMIDAALKDGP